MLKKKRNSPSRATMRPWKMKHLMWCKKGKVYDSTSGMGQSLVRIPERKLLME